VNGLELQLG